MELNMDVLEFETKIRRMISQLVSPLLEKQNQVQKTLSSLKKSSQKHEEAINDLVIAKEEHAKYPRMIEGFEQKLQDLSAEQRTAATHFTQRIEQVLTATATTDHNLGDLADKVKVLARETDSLKDRLKTLTDSVLEFKETTSHNFDTQHIQLAQVSQEIATSQQFNVAERKQLWHGLREATHGTLPQLAVNIASVKRLAQENTSQIQLVGSTKAQVEDVLKLQRDRRADFARTNEIETSLQHLQTFTVQFHDTLESVLPAYTYSVISKTLHNAFSVENLAGFIQFERVHSQTLNNPLKLEGFDFRRTWEEISQRNCEAEQLLEEIEKQAEQKVQQKVQQKAAKAKEQQVESPKKVKVEKPQKVPSKSIVENPFPPAADEAVPFHVYPVRAVTAPVPVATTSTLAPPEPSETSSNNEVVEALTKEVTEHRDQLDTLQSKIEYLVEQLDSAVSSIDKLATETTKNIHKTSEDMLTRLEILQMTLSTNIKLIEGEVQVMSRTKRQEKAEVDACLAQVLEQKSVHETEFTQLNQKLGSVFESVEHVLEFARIAFVLIKQDEDDKESLQLMAAHEPKTSRLHSAGSVRRKSVVTLNPDCMSCNGHNPAVLKAFKMACLNYSPSTVTYNNKVYTRKETLRMLGIHLGQLEDTGVPTLTENKRPCSTRRYRRSSRHILDASSKLLFEDVESLSQSQRNITK